MQNTIYTIGHSAHTIDALIALLKRHQIEVVADVRSVPFSRRNPQFNSNVLPESLRAENVEYLFLGRELGARSEDSRCYRDGQVQYDLLAQTPQFAAGIDRVIRASRQARVALMCSEREPLDCHRTFLVGKAVEEKGIAVCHIRGDGSLETSDEAMSRLLYRLGMPPATLFESRDDLIERACKMQEEVTAYRREAAGAGRP